MLMLGGQQCFNECSFDDVLAAQGEDVCRRCVIYCGKYEILQQGEGDRAIHEQQSLFLISFICRTGDFPCGTAIDFFSLCILLSCP